MSKRELFTKAKQNRKNKNNNNNQKSEQMKKKALDSTLFLNVKRRSDSGTFLSIGRLKADEMRTLNPKKHQNNPLFVFLVFTEKHLFEGSAYICRHLKKHTDRKLT